MPIVSSIHIRAPPAPQHIAFSRVQRELERRVAATSAREDRARRLVLAVVAAEVARLVVDHALELRREREPALGESRAMSCVWWITS